MEVALFRLLAFLSKRADISPEWFRDYYENHHVPLVTRLAPPPPLYERRFVCRDELLNTNEAAIDFDVVTEIGFPDQAGYIAWRNLLYGATCRQQVVEDEAKFLDRARTKTCVISS